MRNRKYLVAGVIAASLFVPTAGTAAVTAQGAVGVAQRSITVTINTSSTNVEFGSEVVLQGTAPKKAKVSIQMKSGKTWVKIKTLKAGKKVWKYEFKPLTSTAYRVQAKIRARVVTSTAVTVSVWNWRYLSDMQETAGYVAEDSGTMLGIYYPKSVGLQSDQDSASSATYALGGKCDRLVTTVGVDDSESDFAEETVNWLISTSGPIAQGSAHRGQGVTPVDASINGAEHITLQQAAVTSNYYDTHDVVFGSAKTHCKV